mgnify:CR=1 FL=1
MNFIKEIEAAIKLWKRRNFPLSDAPREEIVKAMLKDGISIEDAARIAPEGHTS